MTTSDKENWTHAGLQKSRDRSSLCNLCVLLCLCGLGNGGQKQQVEFDMQALQRAIGRTLNEAEQEQFRAIQLQALRWTYLGSAMTHPKFLETVGEFSQAARKQIEELA